MGASLLRLVAVLFALVAPCDALVLGARAGAGAPRAALRNIRAQEAPPPPPRGKLGATVDQDGKSNVWVRDFAAPTSDRASQHHVSHRSLTPP